MNMNIVRENEMRLMKTKILGLMGLVLICASAQVAAEVGQKRMKCGGDECGSREDQKPRLAEPAIPSKDTVLLCETELEQSMNTRRRAGWTPDAIQRLRKFFIDDEKEQLSANSCLLMNKMDKTRIQSMFDGAKRQHDEKVKEWKSIEQQRGSNDQYVLERQFQAETFHYYHCRIQAMVAWCSSNSSASTPPSGITSTNRPPPNLPTNATPSANTNQEAQRLSAQLNEAMARAEKRQADVDRARQGKPKRHVLGAEAHQCLTLIPDQDSLYGGFINSCRYAVEYVYCAYKPKKDSWAEAFDCEKGKFGSWQVGPGPNNRSGMHTKNAERIYYFACRYGETLHKPDGVSPADIEFQRGRGLLGRCAEWGSGGK